MSVATSHANAVVVSDKVYDELVADWRKLEPRKQKNFKSYLCDKRGQRTRVVAKDGRLWNYSLVSKELVPIVRESDANLASFNPTSSLGQAVAAGMPLDAAVSSLAAHNATGNHAGTIRNPVRVPPPAANR